LLRIFFPITFDLFRHWRGGYNLIEGALSALPQDQVQIEIVYVYPGIPEQSGLNKLGKISQHARQHEAVEYLMRQYEAAPKRSVLISLGHCGLWSVGMTRVAYVPDFQHELLSHNFSSDELEARRLGYQVEFATADGLWMSSRAVQKDLKRFVFNLPDKQLILPFPSLRENWSTSGDAQVEKPFILCVSQGWPHKNIDRLIEAWKSLQGSQGQDWTLVIAGNGIVNKEPSLKNIRILSGVDDETLGWLYQNASLFILPSFFEGWSTPVEEAIRFGLPLALSGIEIFREQATDGAVFFDPSSVDSILETLRTLTSNSAMLSALKQSVGRNVRLSQREYGDRLFAFLNGGFR
jgi:glycosyltransferase involved in cell wall biosynthesis